MFNKFGLSYAWISWVEFDDHFYIDFIGVEEEYRQRGLGTLLMKYFINAHSTKPIRLVVGDLFGIQIEILEHFYEKFGFKYTGSSSLMERPAGRIEL